ncbi:hypothetical protein E4U22_004860 [Claviceps purpurea]|nr:hypothetical protein E4U22_004860 [Claviceps purpurea]
MADVPTTGRDEAPAQVASYWGEKQTLSGGNQGVSGTDPFYGVIMATGGSGAQLGAARPTQASGISRSRLGVSRADDLSRHDALALGPAPSTALHCAGSAASRRQVGQPPPHPHPHIHPHLHPSSTPDQVLPVDTL